MHTSHSVYLELVCSKRPACSSLIIIRFVCKEVHVKSSVCSYCVKAIDTGQLVISGCLMLWGDDFVFCGTWLH